MLKRGLIFSSFFIALSSPALAEAPVVRQEWLKAAQKVCGGKLTPLVDYNAIDKEVCAVTCMNASGAVQKRGVLLPNGAPCK
ncbi:hypothetical protein, partial [Corallococcus terminator]|uniref:hypothetical protein n=1 Tax=Corallococcus terminator TaxID=2316733 RepID=UPI001ABF80F9